MDQRPVDFMESFHDLSCLEHATTCDTILSEEGEGRREGGVREKRELLAACSIG
jgi:hypothetical protein